jgi:hypothetical protein
MSARERRRKRNRQELGGISRRQLIAAGGLTAGATLAMSGVAHAAPMTFTVGSLDDTTGASDCATPTNTDCTLRQAILDANDNSGADTIVFASGLTGTITLVGNPDTITEAVAIQGPGASDITVDGDNAYRIFRIDLTPANDPVSISGLRLENGYVSGNGGAIENNNANLSISNAEVKYSSAVPNGNGGGIYSNTGDVTINSSSSAGRGRHHHNLAHDREHGGELLVRLQRRVRRCRERRERKRDRRPFHYQCQRRAGRRRALSQQRRPDRDKFHDHRQQRGLGRRRRGLRGQWGDAGHRLDGDR